MTSVCLAGGIQEHYGGTGGPFQLDPSFVFAQDISRDFEVVQPTLSCPGHSRSCILSIFGAISLEQTKDL